MRQAPITFDDATIAQLFGHEAAEDENPTRLRQYYFKGPTFQRVTADLPLRILVGHKGIGKSALFQVAKHEDSEAGLLTVFLRPDDVHEVQTNSTDLLGSIRNWKTGLIRIIYDKATSSIGAKPESHTVFSSNAGFNLLTALSNAFKPLVDKAVDVSEVKRTLAERFINKSRIRVYIDDLDRGWNATQEGIYRLSSLLNALRDLSRDNEGLQFRISLRSDVFFLVRTSDESTDKIEGSVVWYSWTNHEILALLIKRLLSFRGLEVPEAQLIATEQHVLASNLDMIMQPRFLGHGGWKNIPTYRMLMSLIRRRPRDLVKICSLAAQKAHERRSSLIGTDDFNAVFDQYSQGRLNDSIVEFRSELPSIERLLLNMRPTNAQRKLGKKPFNYTTADLLTRVGDIQQNHGPFMFYGSRRATNKDLAAFLYKIGFLTARKDVGPRIERRFFEEHQYLSSSFTDFGFDWEVHPAFRWALKPESIQDMFDALDGE